jgi:pimeloyl-ACP methyl ester carboxylesterase
MVAGCLALAGSAGSASAALKVNWMRGFNAPGTPAKYNKVGVLEVGPASARNVLVLEPGTSAGSAYFVPLARWLVRTVPGWQVWSVERRENLLEDQSVFNLAKRGKANAIEVFNYYLGFLEPGSHITHHLPSADLSRNLPFAKKWGLNVAIQDLHRVIEAARKLGGKVVLGGHSLGGSVVTAYATWNFAGKPGARELAGLVYDDGGSLKRATAAEATSALQQLNAPSTSPWLAFGGIPAPFAGIYSTSGALSVLQAPNMPSLGQASGLLPPDLVPPVRVTNEAQYGFALNVGTSPTALAAAQGHLGKGVSPKMVNGAHTWDGSGALSPIKRFATMFSGAGIQNVDGTEWYFPTRLTDDEGGVNQGNRNPAQKILNVHAVFGHKLPRRLLIYAFGALGGPLVTAAAQTLAQQSHIPKRNLTLVNEAGVYAHNDPAAAFPHNVFFTHLVRFLRKVDRLR